ncbi:MAG: Sua5/YciO/YrdC/YwlC family protein [Myxococcota bacterium]
MKPEHPQPRHIERTAQILRSGGIAIYPTDTTYGLGCDIYSRRSIDRIYQLKGLERSHPLSFLCSDLSEVARYASRGP